MSNDAERRWTMLEQALNAEALGYDVKPFVSNRTLFGIRPTAEVILDEYVAQEEAKRKAARKAEKEAAAICDASNLDSSEVRGKSETTDASTLVSGDILGRNSASDASTLGSGDVLGRNSASPSKTLEGASSAAKKTADATQNSSTDKPAAQLDEDAQAFKRYGEWYTRK